MLYGCLSLLVVSGVSAGEENIEQSADQILSKTRIIITDHMTWSEQERALFWPAYGDYEKNVRGIIIELLSAIQKYYQESDMLSDEEAKALAKRYFNLRIKKAELWKSFVMGLYEILPPRKLLKLIEVEHQIETGYYLKILLEASRAP
jgi:hypothetical protein